LNSPRNEILGTKRRYGRAVPVGHETVFPNGMGRASLATFLRDERKALVCAAAALI
jgi:hypothetical protein